MEIRRKIQVLTPSKPKRELDFISAIILLDVRIIVVLRIVNIPCPTLGNFHRDPL